MVQCLPVNRMRVTIHGDPSTIVRVFRQVRIHAHLEATYSGMPSLVCAPSI